MLEMDFYAVQQLSLALTEDILTKHTDDVVPVIRNSEAGGNTAHILALPKVHPHDGLHHGDVEEEEQKDWQEEEEEKRQFMDWVPL